MLSGPRFEAEQRLMLRHHPHFRPFVTDSEAGFYGMLRGPRTGRWYVILVKARIEDFPQNEAGVYMRPQVGHHWYKGGKLCWHPEGGRWKAAQNTFAKAIWVAAEYLKESD